MGTVEGGTAEPKGSSRRTPATSLGTTHSKQRPRTTSPPQPPSTHIQTGLFEPSPMRCRMLPQEAPAVPVRSTQSLEV